MPRFETDSICAARSMGLEPRPQKYRPQYTGTFCQGFERGDDPPRPCPLQSPFYRSQFLPATIAMFLTTHETSNFQSLHSIRLMGPLYPTSKAWAHTSRTRTLKASRSVKQPGRPDKKLSNCLRTFS